MEKIKDNMLSQIFRFSWIWNIFPFYGTLPKWMWIMKMLNSETNKIWEENKKGFMIAGKNYKEGQKFEVLKKALESDIFEDKLEFWSNFDYWRHHMYDARDLVLLLIYKGMKVFLRQSEKKGYDFNLALFEPDFNKEYLDSHFDPQGKTFEPNNEIWKYVNWLIEKGITMISMKNNLIIVQLVPSSISYINDCWKFLKLDEKEKENYFKKNCGLSPTTIQFNNKDWESIKIMSDILSTTSTINKINIKNSIYYTNEFNMLLFLMKIIKN